MGCEEKKQMKRMSTYLRFLGFWGARVEDGASAGRPVFH